MVYVAAAFVLAMFFVILTIMHLFAKLIRLHREQAAAVEQRKQLELAKAETEPKKTYQGSGLNRLDPAFQPVRGLRYIPTMRVVVNVVTGLAADDREFVARGGRIGDLPHLFDSQLTSSTQEDIARAAHSPREQARAGLTLSPRARAALVEALHEQFVNTQPEARQSPEEIQRWLRDEFPRPTEEERRVMNDITRRYGRIRVEAGQITAENPETQQIIDGLTTGEARAARSQGEFDSVGTLVVGRRIPIIPPLQIPGTTLDLSQVRDLHVQGTIDGIRTNIPSLNRIEIRGVQTGRTSSRAPYRVPDAQIHQQPPETPAPIQTPGRTVRRKKPDA